MATIEEIRQKAIANNPLVMKKAETKNIILVGRSRCGKSSAIRMLVDAVAVERPFSLYSETKEAFVTQFCMEVERNGVMTAFNLTVLDTPGLFEWPTSDEKARSEAALIESTSLCLAQNITRIHAIFFVMPFKRVTVEDACALQMFAGFFSGATCNMALLISRSEDRTPEMMDDLKYGQLPRTIEYSELLALASTSRLFRLIQRTDGSTLGEFRKFSDVTAKVMEMGEEQMLVRQQSGELSWAILTPAGGPNGGVATSLTEPVSEEEINKKILRDEEQRAAKCKALGTEVPTKPIISLEVRCEVVQPFRLMRCGAQGGGGEELVREFALIEDVARYAATDLNLWGKKILWHQAREGWSSWLTLPKQVPPRKEDGSPGSFVQLLEPAGSQGVAVITGPSDAPFVIRSNDARVFFSGVIRRRAVQLAAATQINTFIERMSSMRWKIIDFLSDIADADSFDLHNLRISRTSRNVVHDAMEHLAKVNSDLKRAIIAKSVAAIPELVSSAEKLADTVSKLSQFIAPAQISRATELVRAAEKLVDQASAPSQ